MGIYDLTGAVPEFSKTIQVKVFEANQLIELPEPAFANSIIVTWLKPDTTTQVMSTPTDWTYTSADRDIAAMSEARLQDEVFNSTLVKSIKSLAVVSGIGRTYAITYQRFRLGALDRDYGSVGPEPTRGLMKDIVENVNHLLAISNPLGEITSVSTDSIKILDEDLTASLDDNYILNEVHTVNVPAGRQVIRVASGSFYEKDFRIVNPASGLPLIRGSDYELIGLNRPKTRIAGARSGVYDYAFLLKSFVGPMNVTYRAFGGQVTQKDINAIKDVLADVVKLIHVGGYITAEALPSTLTIVSILQRLAELEDYVNHYKETNHRFRPTTTGKHWFTVAKLHKDRWESILSQGQGQLAIVSGNFGWTYNFSIAINFGRSDENMKVKVIGSLDKTSDFAVGEYPDLALRNIPEVRVIWDGSLAGNDLSGAIIQVGYNMEANVLQNLAVRNIGGNVSDIKIVDASSAIVNVADNNIVLPEGTVWTTGANEVRSLLIPEAGYLAWAGALPVTDIPSGLTEYDHVIGSTDLDLSCIGVVKFYFYDRINDRIIVATSEHAWDDREDLNRSILFFAEDLCGIGYKIYRDIDASIKLKLSASVGSHSTLNKRFDLRQIVFYT